MQINDLKEKHAATVVFITKSLHEAEPVPIVRLNQKLYVLSKERFPHLADFHEAAQYEQSKFLEIQENGAVRIKGSRVSSIKEIDMKQVREHQKDVEFIGAVLVKQAIETHTYELLTEQRLSELIRDAIDTPESLQGLGIDFALVESKRFFEVEKPSLDVRLGITFPDQKNPELER